MKITFEIGLDKLKINYIIRSLGKMKKGDDFTIKSNGLLGIPVDIIMVYSSKNYGKTKKNTTAK